MPDNLEATRHLAQFVAETEWDALTPAAIHQAKRALVNFFAVALTGCREGAIETALQSLASFSAGDQATVIGRDERLDALSAAFLNAASANVLDFCDRPLISLPQRAVSSMTRRRSKRRCAIRISPALGSMSGARSRWRLHIRY